MAPPPIRPDDNPHEWLGEALLGDPGRARSRSCHARRRTRRGICAAALRCRLPIPYPCRLATNRSPLSSSFLVVWSSEQPFREPEPSWPAIAVSPSPTCRFRRCHRVGTVQRHRNCVRVKLSTTPDETEVRCRLAHLCKTESRLSSIGDLRLFFSYRSLIQTIERPPRLRRA